MKISSSFLLNTWHRLTKLPRGSLLYSKLVGKAAPFTSTISAEMLELAPGRGKALMRDRKKVRNHLNSIHAMALANFAEFASGLALNVSIPDETHSILTGFEITYVKKARGDLTAETEFPPVNSTERTEYIIPVTIKNPQQEVVATANAKWLVSLRPQRDKPPT